MADKHTKKELFETLIVLASAAEADAWIVEGLEHELDLLARKSGNKTADVKRKAEQAVVKDAIASALAGSVAPMRSGEIGLAIGESTQKVTALVGQMVKDGIVTRHEDKKVVTFSL